MTREVSGLLWDIVLTFIWAITETYWGFNVWLGAMGTVALWGNFNPWIVGLLLITLIMGNIGIYLIRRDQREDEEEQ